MQTYEQLLQGNKDFVESMTSKDPQYFERLAEGQNPEVLWIAVQIAECQPIRLLILSQVKFLFTVTLQMFVFILI